ncbi:MAG: hypothetical protein ACRETW_02950, partial [Stenotrophobium sp.]
MRGMLFRAVALYLCVLGTAHADPGLNWLSAQANTDGSIARSSDIATPFQATAESLRTLALYGVTSGASITAAQQYLASQTYHNTENLSRLIIAGVTAGQDVSALVTELLTHQDTITGGFVESQGYQPTVLDTDFALEALALAGNPGSAVAGPALGFLQQQQNADGSWQDGDNNPSVYLTALAVNALRYYSSSYNVAQTLQNGTSFLFSARQSDGLWGEDALSAESLIALTQSLVDFTPAKASVQTLQTHQLTDGSWGDDVFTTALVLRTLALAQARGTTPPAGNGAVQGYV